MYSNLSTQNNDLTRVNIPKVSAGVDATACMAAQNDSQSATYAFAPSVADSADWSQYSETDSVYNGRTSPDPFDTSNIITPPPASRYYSTVPQHQSAVEDNSTQQNNSQVLQENNKLSDINIIREFDTLNKSDSSEDSANHRDYQNKPESPVPPKVVKPPLELLKKRDEAFSWLDDTLGGLRIGQNPKVEELPSVNGQKQAPTLNNLGSRSSSCLNNLDSGDEVWNNFADVSDNSHLAQQKAQPPSFIQNLPPSQSQKTSPYALLPPPSFVRCNSVNAVGGSGNHHRQNGRTLPAYRPPPEPQNSGRNQYGHLPMNSDFAHTSAQNLDPVAILSSKVPSASRDEIRFALQSCRDVGLAEKSLKVDQLMK